MATTKEIILSLKTTFDGAGLDSASRNLDKIAVASAQVDSALAGMGSEALKAQRNANEMALTAQRTADSQLALARALNTVEIAYKAAIDPATAGAGANDRYAQSIRSAALAVSSYQRDLSALARLKEADVAASERQAAAADKAAAAAKRQADAPKGGGSGSGEGGGFGRAANAVAQNFAYSGVPGAGLAFGLPAAAVGAIAVAGAGIYAIQQASGLDNRVRQLIGGTTGDNSQVDAYKQGFLNIAKSPGINVSAQDLATTAYPILSSYTSARTPDALTALKAGVQDAIGVNADPSTFISGVIKELEAYGLSLTQFKRIADLNVAAIRAGSADPTGLASGVGTFGNTAASAGVSPTDAQAAFSNATLTSRDAQQSAFDANSFFQTFSRHATATQSRVAGDLGLSLGPDALSKATLPGYIGQFQAATSSLTDAQRQRVGYALTGNEAAAAFLSSNTGSRYGSYLATQASLNQSPGAGQSAFNTVANGPDQQAAAALNRLKADVTEVGNNLLPLKAAAGGASLAMLGLAETGIPKLTTAIQDFAVQANSGMDGFVAYVRSLKNPGDIPKDVGNGLVNAAGGAGNFFGNILGQIGNSTDAAVSAAAGGVGSGASGIAQVVGRGKAIYDQAANNASAYNTNPPPAPKAPPPAAAGSYGSGGDNYPQRNIADIFGFGKGYQAPAVPRNTPGILSQRQQDAQQAAQDAAANTQANVDRIHKNATSAGTLTQAISDQQNAAINAARGQNALRDSLGGAGGRNSNGPTKYGPELNNVPSHAGGEEIGAPNLDALTQQAAQRRADNSNNFALAQLTVDPAAAKRYGAALIQDELASKDSASTKRLLIAQINAEITAVGASAQAAVDAATARKQAAAAQRQALAVQTSNEALRGANLTYSIDQANNAPLSTLNRDSAGIRAQADRASRRADVGANAYLLPNDLRQNAFDQTTRDRGNSLALAQQAGQAQVNAANLQLQAAQAGLGNASATKAAADVLYKATLAFDKTIQNPADRANADKAAGLARTATNRGVDLTGANKILGQDTEQISVDKAKGLPYGADVAKLLADTKRFSSLTGATPLDIEALRLQNTPQITPRTPPTFAPGEQDPGIEAGRGSAAFRTGVYSRDSKNDEVAILRQQLAYDQQTIATQREQIAELRGIKQAILSTAPERSKSKGSLQVGAAQRGKN